MKHNPPFYYYCYISQSKVTQLLSIYEKHELQEVSEKREAKKEKSGEIGFSKILEILSLKMTYGRSDMYHRELKMRETITSKLFRLLELIKFNVNDLDETKEVVESNFYYTNLEFKVDSIDYEHNIVNIESSINEKILKMQCSLNFFSSNSDFSKPLEINSSNYAFLKLGYAIRFDTVFVCITKRDNEIIGTPLFLSLASNYGNL